MHEIRKGAGQVDAAFILDRSMGSSVTGLLHSVPFVLSTDMTPALKAQAQRLGGILSPAGRSVRRAVARAAYLRAYRILPWSTVVKESLVQDYGIPEDRITLLSPGINLRLWTATDRAEETEFRDRFKVLHVSNDFALKGGERVLALAREEEFREVEFHCVTPGRIGPIPGNVMLHPMLKPNSEGLRKVYREADVLVLPTLAETFSLVALEAMASALPVIAYNVGGMSDLVEDGRTGFLVSPGDHDGLRERLRELRANAALRISMGKAGRERAEAGFDLQRHVETIIDLLRQASRSRPGTLHP
jgi:glycosyltransferase involved in cell wall biosynthesis